MKKTGIIIGLITIILDFLTKILAVKYFVSGIKLTSFFNLALTYNKGISFGLFNNFSYSNYFFAALSSAISLMLYNWLKKTDSCKEAIALGLIIGGALGNVIDRFIYPGVVDFLEFHWKQYYWPSFNLADSAIFLGVCILLIFSIDLRKIKS